MTSRKRREIMPLLSSHQGKEGREMTDSLDGYQSSYAERLEIVSSASG
jgi:hypothetical protein